MGAAKSAFCKNVRDLVVSLGISQSDLYKAEVEHSGEMASISPRTVDKIISAAVEPRIETKAIIAKVIEKLRPELKLPLVPLALESQTFMVADYLPDRNAPVQQRFDVDFLRSTVDKIAESARSKRELVNQLLCIPIEDAKDQFWNKIRAILKRLGIKDKAFNEALVRGGMPPLSDDERLIDCATRINDKPGALGRDQALIWKIATAAYPPFNSSGNDPELKKAARYLAWYWYYTITRAREMWELSIVEDFGRRKPAEEALVYVLSWLELSLVTQTGNPNGKKVGLFALGCWFQQQARQAAVRRRPLT